jgi:hypothetical protein
MKNFIFILLCCVCCSTISMAQSPEVLNNYKYVYFPQLTYDKGKTDIYGIRKTVADKLKASSVPLFLEENEISTEAMRNPCTMLHCIVNNTASSKGPGFSDILILFLTCKNDTILNCSAVAALRSNQNDTRQSFINATQKAMEVFSSYQYRFSNPDSSTSVEETIFNDADSIQWNSGRKLSWDDFLGTVDNHYPADALTYTTHQSSFRAFGIGNRFHVESDVVCCFIKSKSWVKEEAKTDYLLNHEQRHFDIAEAGAREFRKNLKAAHFTSENFQNEVQKITREIDEKYKKIQAEYDKETNHSRIEEKQKEWNSKIDSMLKNLEVYK